MAIGQEVIEQILQGKKHEGYKLAGEVAKLAKQITSGKNQDDLVLSYKVRENADQKKQRLAIYKPITQYAAGKVIKLMQKAARVDNVKRGLKVESKDKSKEQRLSTILSNFFRAKSFENYLMSVWMRSSYKDPNAVLLIDRTEIKEETGKVSEVVPIPVFFASKDVVWIEYGVSGIQYAVLKKERVVNVVSELKFEKGKPVTQSKGETVTTYWVYERHIGTRYRQLAGNEQPAEGLEVIEIGKTETSDGGKFEVFPFTHGSREVPILQLGVDMSDENENVFVTPLEPAMPIFSELINQKSEFDLTKALHTFLQKIALAPPCTFSAPNGHLCKNGKVPILDADGLRITGHADCPKCGGTGVDVHRTTQDVILIKMPESQEQLIPMADFVRYVELPEWLPKWQDEQIEKIISRISLAIFNTDIFTKPNSVATATERVLEYDKVYDVIYHYMQAFSTAYRRGVGIIADYLEIENVTVTHEYPRDFRMKTISDLLLELEASKKSGASFVVQNAIEEDILEKTYPDEADMIARSRAVMSLQPFSEKSAAEVNVILSNRAATDPDRLIYENFYRIVRLLDERFPQWYLKPYSEQYRTAEQVANEIAAGIKQLSFNAE